MTEWFITDDIGVRQRESYEKALEDGVRHVERLEAALKSIRHHVDGCSYLTPDSVFEVLQTIRDEVDEVLDDD